jgi:hypothetical protein
MVCYLIGQERHPTGEMLEQLHRAKYMTSLDLTSALLQIPLEASSRKGTETYTILIYYETVFKDQCNICL